MAKVGEKAICVHLAWECYDNGDFHVCSDCGETLTLENKSPLECNLCGYTHSTRALDEGWVTKDSGKREEYVSGMRRDVQEGKPRFDLLLTDGLPYEEQFLTRFANLLDRGAEKYGERNWELANSTEELARFKASALRHMMQWACGEEDEDHASAVAFNLMAYEYVKWKLSGGAVPQRYVMAWPVDE